MTIMKRITYMLLAVLAMAGCQNRYEKLYEDLKVDAPAYVISAVDSIMAIPVYYSYRWTASIDDGGEWMSMDKQSGNGISTLHLRFEPNHGLSRVAFLRLAGEGNEQVIKLTQRSGVALPRIEFEKQNVKIPAGSYALSLPFDSNVPGKYFSGIPVRAVYEGGEEPWVSDAGVIADRESPLDREDMPDGVIRYLGARTASYSGSQPRKVRLVLKLSDAEGTEYADSVTIEQSGDKAYITASGKDIVNMPGGSRETVITTNIAFASRDFVLDVEYPDPACTGFISNPELSGLALRYDVAENADNKVRRANIRISYTDLDGVSCEAVQAIEQNSIPESFDNYQVYNADQLVAWNSSNSKWKETDNITLCADIDMGGTTWTGHRFKGKFNGNGHRIYNFHAANRDTVAFFSSMTAQAILQDIVFGSADGINYDGQSSFEQSEVREDAGIFTGIVGMAEGISTISGVTSFIPVTISSAPAKGSYCGAICGNWASGGQLKDCVNYGDVTSTVCGTGSINLAGIAGSVHGTGTILHCVNHGKIQSHVDDATGNTINMGGIAAYTPAASRFESCENRGRLVVSGAFKRTKDTNVGGIISYPGTGADVKVTACSNYADIVNESASATNMRLGGISSYVHAEAKVEYRNCHNYGKISNCGECTHSSETGSLVMGGIAGLDAGVVTIDGCSNEGMIQDSNPGTGNMYAELGGIAGRATNASTITNCVNKGSIQRINGAVKNIYMGGILGFSVTTPFSTFKGNVNEASAEILCSADIVGGGTCHIAGITGYSKVAIVLENCSNAANVTMSGTGDYCYFAGIIGRCEIAGNRILNCTNSGNVTNSGADTRANGLRLGGIIGQSRYTEISGCTNSGNVANTNTSINAANYVGGIIGLNNNNISQVKNCTIMNCKVSSSATSGKNLSLIANTNIGGTIISDNTIRSGNSVDGVTVSAANFESVLAAGIKAGEVVKSANKYEE